MNGPALTWRVIVGVVIFCFAYDLFAVFRWGVPATITDVMRERIRSAPEVAFLAGLVCGHLFLSALVRR